MAEDFSACNKRNCSEISESKYLEVKYSRKGVYREIVFMLYWASMNQPAFGNRKTPTVT